MDFSDDTNIRHGDSDQDGLGSKLSREAALLLSGGLGGIAQGAKNDAADPVGTGLKLAGSVGVGLALGAMERGGGLVGLTATLGSAAFTTSFITDVLAPGRLGKLSTAISNTWKSPDNFSDNVQSVRDGLGQVTFDTLVMTGAGVSTKLLTDRFLLPESKAVLQKHAEQPLDTKLKLVPEKSAAEGGWTDRFSKFFGDKTAKTRSVSSIVEEIANNPDIKWRKRPVPKSLAAALEDFPHRAVGHVDSGMDNIVIELTGNRVLKIRGTPLQADFGRRDFDLPYLEKGKIADYFDYVIQPKGTVVTSKETMRRFAADVRSKGYNFWDQDPSQLVIYNGQVKLHDYDAVAKLTLGQKKTGT